MKNRKDSFSRDIENWLKSNKPKTLAGINEVFSEKSFAVIFFLLMSLSATPIPTGGITNVFEIIVMLLSLEIIAGRRSIWIPKIWRHKPINATTEKKLIPFLIKRLKWFEKFSSQSSYDFENNRMIIRLSGILVFIFTLASFLSPPFSGLDTLPSIGVVAVALALLFNDLRLFIIGSVIGFAGIVLLIGLGRLLLNVVF